MVKLPPPGQAQSALMPNGYGMSTVPHLLGQRRSGNGGAGVGGEAMVEETAAVDTGKTRLEWENINSAGERRNHSTRGVATTTTTRCFMLVFQSSS